MPSHPDRVRRNYHTIVLRETDIPRTCEQLIQISITKAEIATPMTRRDVENHILRLIQRGIREQYVDR